MYDAEYAHIGQWLLLFSCGFWALSSGVLSMLSLPSLPLALKSYDSANPLLHVWLLSPIPLSQPNKFRPSILYFCAGGCFFWDKGSLYHPGCPGTQKSACLCFLSAGIKGLVLFKDFPFASQLVWPSWSDVICLRILTYLVQIINLWSHWDILLCFGSRGGTCEASVLFSFWDRVSLICPG